MKKLLAAALLALPGLCPASAAEAPPATVTAARPSPEQQQWLSRGRRTERDGWIHLRIDGAPRERGFQHGYLLAKEIDSSLRTTRKRRTIARDGLAVAEEGRGHVRAEGRRGFSPRSTARWRAWRRPGVKTSRGEIIANNGITELAGLMVAGGEGDDRGPARPTSPRRPAAPSSPPAA